MFGTKINKDKEFKVCELVSESDVFEYVYDFLCYNQHPLENRHIAEIFTTEE